MKKTLRLFCCLLALLLVSCNHDDAFKGFKEMENGAFMKFVSRGTSDIMPRLNDEVTLEMAQYFDDSLLFTTAGEEPMHFVVREADFVGDVSDGLLMMHVGDSARLMIIADSVFLHSLQMDEVPAEYVGMPLYYDIKLLSVKPFETLEAEHKALLDSLSQEEEAFLSPLKSDPKNTITPSGLIVMEKKGNGRVARLGDYVDFDFTMCSPNGDTIMNSFGVEPVEIQYGEDFICTGITEALGMVPEGGMMRFVVPSALAFDSTGYEQYIMPYTPLSVVIRVNDVMDKASYERKLAALQAAHEAEKARMAALESKTIKDYVKSHGITVNPTETGLYLIPQEEGTGDVAKMGDKVSVHYLMKNMNDEVIESSYDYGMPMTFTLGSGEMVPAIEEALQTMAPGAKVTVITPSAQAFGEFDLGENLPPYSPLVIELELMEIK